MRLKVDQQDGKPSVGQESCAPRHGGAVCADCVQEKHDRGAATPIQPPSGYRMPGTRQPYDFGGEIGGKRYGMIGRFNQLRAERP
jgi:hypothetical protein